jgi:hypothetical protein
MSGVRTRGRGARYAGTALIVLVVLAGLAGLFFLINPLVTAVHTITGGNSGADVALGLGFVLFPLLVMIGYADLARRRGWRQQWGWWLLVLYLPAFELEPYGRAGTNTQLQYRLDTQLPGLLGGMAIGVGVLVLAVAVLVVLAKRRQRRT